MPIALRMAAWLLPADARQEILGDLVEHWHRHVRHRPLRARSAWLWRQPLSAVRGRLRFREREPRARASNRLDRRRPAAAARRTGLGVSWLDVKLGLRMLVKHPGVTLVVVFALGVGIPVSLAPHHFMDAVLDTPLPFEDGEDIVGLVMWDRQASDQVSATLRDFWRWRRELTAYEAIGAARAAQVNLITDEGAAAPTRGAAMSASAFAMTRIPPLIGRTLLPADEVVGAPDVVVIGNDVWRARFAGNPDVVGTTVLVAGVSRTVVGVMPEGFYFPSHHQVWWPLRTGSGAAASEADTPLWVFGRLADGVGVEHARAELTAAGQRMAAQDPERYAHLLPEVVPYAALAVGTPRGAEWIEVYLIEAFPLALLFLACGNVAILLLARAANRSSEVAVRTALGATRSRIVSQLFVEALLLACLATGVGLVAIDVLVARFVEPYMGGLFWVDVGVTPGLVGKAFLLAVPSAAIAGVLPALRATGGGVSSSLQSMGSGAGGIRFGKASAALIVAEVALGVGCLFAAGMGYRLYRPQGVATEPTVAAERFLTADIAIPGPGGGVEGPEVVDAAHAMRIAERHRAIARRLTAEAGVSGVAIAASPPGQRDRGAYVQVDGIEDPPDRPGHYTRVSEVSVGFFPALGLSARQGRLFDDRDLPADIGGARTAVVVDSVFVDHVLGGRNAIGQSVRFVQGADSTGPAYEIVGVVPRVVTARQHTSPGEVESMLYLPASPGELHPFTLAIDVGEEPASFAPRLREIVAEVDPAAVVDEVVPLADIVDYDVLLGRYVSVFLATLAGISLVLSIAGLYALMSFTVAQRTREMGIRTALGGSPERIVASVAGRAMFQLGLGVALGVAFWITVLLAVTPPRGEASPVREWPFVLAATALAVIAVGLVACLVPTRRGLRVRPMDALRADG